MTKDEAVSRVCELRNLLDEANKQYYDQAQPVISDRQYDTYMQELMGLEDAYGLHDPASPSRRVGESISEAFTTVEHPRAMLSLANTYNEQELREFDRRVKDLLGSRPFTYFVELKFDGMALRLRYENGVLQLAATRGNGRQGDDITQNVRTLRDIPLKLSTDNWPEIVEVRGEAYMEREAFARFNAQRQENGEAAFANPRNATAGSLKLLDSSLTARRPIRFFCYDLILDQETDSTHLQRMQMLEQWGLRVCSHRWTCQTIEDVLKIIQSLEHTRKDLPYDTDGVVVKVNEDRYREELGYTAKAPKWAIAYKFEAEQATTTIRDITLQVGRLGTITPVAELEPVLLAGTTVKRASLHNQDEITRKDIRIGDRVIIEKAGEIIPQVVQVASPDDPGRSQPYVIPLQCPACQSELVQSPGEVALRCVNPECPPQVRIRIEHFASRDAMDIDGMGEAVIDQLVGANLIHNYADLYKLTVEDLLPLDRMAQKSARNLIHAIQQSKNKPFDRLLFGLGIRFVGSTVARDLADAYSTIDALMQASEDQIADVHGIGVKIAASVRDFMDRPENQRIIEQLRDYGLKLHHEKQEVHSNSLEGCTFVITGTLPSLSRKEAAELIQAHAGSVTGSVSKNTTYVLAGESAGSKLDKAQKLGIKVVSEEDLKSMIS
ncbi:MAG: NAD-dependent aldehyde dehydrogenase [Bacteroidetes bacterium HLUCCA01]|nr:MAG: NAD-dependent aldehyde dehydrogenase [Bacteroidetes bacterium HLUCCA01]